MPTLVPEPLRLPRPLPPRPAADLPPLDGDLLLRAAPRFRGTLAARQHAIIGAIGGALHQTLVAWRIDSVPRVAHFLAQTCHESAGFRTTEEFASGADYDTGRLAVRLGNTPEQDGDGQRFKGRGLIQLTGRDNYLRAGAALGLPLLRRPEIAAEPVTSLRIACWFWDARGCNRPADRDDLVAVTRLVNGGTNGLADRRACLARARKALAAATARALARLAGPGARPVLCRGAAGAAVVELQRALRQNGFELAVDGAFGPATELAVRLWQRRRGLGPDGIVGPRTWQRLGL